MSGWLQVIQPGSFALLDVAEVVKPVSRDAFRHARLVAVSISAFEQVETHVDYVSDAGACRRLLSFSPGCPECEHECARVAALKERRDRDSIENQPLVWGQRTDEEIDDDFYDLLDDEGGAS